MLQTQRTQLSTQDSVAAASADVGSDQVRLYKALGGGWQMETGELALVDANGTGLAWVSTSASEKKSPSPASSSSSAPPSLSSALPSGTNTLSPRFATP